MAGLAFAAAMAAAAAAQNMPGIAAVTVTHAAAMGTPASHGAGARGAAPGAASCMAPAVTGQWLCGGTGYHG